MISTKTIIDKANAKITAGLTEEEIIQLSVINESATKSKFTVATLADLPSAGDNTGRLAYVEENFLYYFSDGVEWLNDFKSVLQISAAAAWGNNGSSKLGNVGLAGEKSSPTMVSGGITNWSVVSAGWDHSLGLTSSGIIYTWGAGPSGQLGNGLASSSYGQPTAVVGITDWSAGSAGRFHSLGLRANGVLYAWGRGTNGQLGNGTAINRSSPVTVVGGITNWSTIKAGRYFSLGLTDTGILYAWGAGGSGQLGNNSTINRSSPVTVVGGITNWSAISTGDLYHSLGLTDTGVLYAWGNGGSGRLGDNTAINKSSPVTVVGGITNWSAISAGYSHNLGLTDTGVLYAWGAGSSGQLGTNEATAFGRSSPVTVVGGITNWSAISAGFSHSLGLTSSGVLYAWGLGNNGRLGDGTTIRRSSPVTVVGGITSWSQISAGYNHNLAIYQNQKGFNEP